MKCIAKINDKPSSLCVALLFSFYHFSPAVRTHSHEVLPLYHNEVQTPCADGETLRCDHD